MPELIDRFVRQRDLVPADALADLQITIIGVGAIGRQVGLQLASMGVRRLQLIDFDKVEWTNVTSQGYLPRDLEISKVTVLSHFIAEIDASIDVEVIEDRYRPIHQVGPAIFCCVDSITARSAIWKSAGTASRFWCDGRMLGEVMRILTVAGEAGAEHYPKSLFAQSEAQSGNCTAQSTIYTAGIAAGLMIHQFVRWLRHQPIDVDLSLNLLASEMTCIELRS